MTKRKLCSRVIGQKKLQSTKGMVHVQDRLNSKLAMEILEKRRTHKSSIAREN